MVKYGDHSLNGLRAQLGVTASLTRALKNGKHMCLFLKKYLTTYQNQYRQRDK